MTFNFSVISWKSLFGLLSLFLLQQFCKASQAFEMEGSKTSYAKFPKWDPCQNGSIQFEFRTSQLNGILLYADDGGKYDFIEVKLVAGMVRLRQNFGSGTLLITAGQHLEDEKWHKLKIQYNGSQTKLILDGILNAKTSSGPDFKFGNPMSNSDLFIGGLPIGHIGRLRMLSLPSIMFEPRYRGGIRHLTVSHCGGTEVNPTMLDYQGVSWNQNTDRCAEKDPCHHGSICVSTKAGYICDCPPNYIGEHCEQEVTPSEATFYGSEYISYNLTERGNAILSSRDQVSVWFKTRQANGLLFFTGESIDHIILFLSKGALFLSVNLGSGSFERSNIHNRNGMGFDDNEWHSVTVTRQARELTLNKGICEIDLSVDGHQVEAGTAAGDFSMLSSRVLYVGGSENVADLRGSQIKENFRGCLKQVYYRADSISLDLLSLAAQQNDMLSVEGHPSFEHCDDLAYTQPISFLTEDSMIKVPMQTLTDSGSITFSFRTSEPTGLLMYSPGIKSVSDFFALEIFEGGLYLILDLGSGAMKEEVTQGVKVNDSLIHRVVLTHTGGGKASTVSSGSISVDGITKTYTIRGRNSQLDLEKTLHIGGFGDLSVSQFPIEVWSATMMKGYVGCFQELEVNANKIDIAQLARAQGVSGMGNYCQEKPPLCTTKPCLHQGVCSEGWNRYLCDCSGTGYTGPMCNRVAVTFSFDGSQYLTISLTNQSVTEVEYVSVRFKTDRENGLLFTTSSSTTEDKLTVSLDRGRIRVDINLAGVRQTTYDGQGLNDNEWHTVRVRRRYKRLLLNVDDGVKVKEKISMKDPVMHIDEFNLASENGSENARLHGAQDNSIAFDEIHLAKKPSPTTSSSSPENFVGHMQQFIFNNQNFFERAYRMGNVRNIDTNAKFDQEAEMVKFPVTFKTPSSYLVMRHSLAGTFAIFLCIKTTQPDGLILYSGSRKANDFIALEIFDGQVRCVLDVGNGPRVLESTNGASVSDNKWHYISVIKSGQHQMVLQVDDSSTFDNMAKARTTQLDTDGEIFMGGAIAQVFTNLPNQVKSRMGYQGCLGNVDLDEEEVHSLFDSADEIREEYMEEILEGCEGPVELCQPDYCKNRGVCIQHWDKIICNCDLTSYTGETCAEVSTAYRFNPGDGIIHFHLPLAEQKATKVDELALGFITTQADAILARINSADSNDYIQLELVGGNILIVYNMGSLNHPVGDMFAKMNDGQYHVVRFRRSGPNATLQVDDRAPQTKNPIGHQLSIFNNQSDVYIGGKKDLLGKILLQFEGTIAGFVLNGRKILDLAASGDPRVTVVGNVELDTSLKLPTTASVLTTLVSTRTAVNTTPAGPLTAPDTMSTMPTNGNGSDSIIQSSGSGCEVSEENCNSNPPDNNSLIVPSVKVTDKRPSTTSTQSPQTTDMGVDEQTTVGPEESSGNSECDDEEGDGCPTSSGPEMEDVTDDISFGTSDEETTATQSIVINPNMTEVPPSERRPDLTNTAPPGKKPGRGGGGPGGGGNQNTPNESETKDSNSGNPLSLNIGLIIGIAAGVVLLLFILAYAVYKYRSRDEGTYKVDETKNYRYETVSTKVPSQQLNGNSTLTKPISNGSKPKKKGAVKEWYV